MTDRRSPGNRNLDLPEQRILYVAHIYGSYHCAEKTREICRSRTSAQEASQFTEEEFQAGFKLAEEHEHEYQLWCGTYGSPEYGGWAYDPRDGRRKPRQVIDADQEVLSGS